jgi:hypothetical protein
MKHGIVAGEPGIFPWPFGHLYGRLGGWLHRRHQASEAPATPGADQSPAGPSDAAESPPDQPAG